MRILVPALTLAALLVSLPAGAAPIWKTCRFAAGALPVDTQRGQKLHGSDIPVDHIVILMQENRSFDHYFGQLRRQSGPPRNAANPDPTGGSKIRPFHQTHYCEVADLDHSWNGTHQEWNHGRMNGFTKANVDAADPNGHRTMGFYTADDLPFYYALYSTFAIGDRYFASALTQTFPNRFYFLAGTSFGHIRNDFPSPGADFAQRSIFNLLDEASPPVTWKIYASQVAFANLFGYVRNTRTANLALIGQYYVDAQAGTLPQVTFVDPIFASSKNVETDEHPPANVQVGQQFAASVVDALMASPLWPRSALFLTYDEHGGFYDHVNPPRACKPDDIAPMLQSDDVRAKFDHYGIRVPVAVVSPFARRQFVSHVVHDHTSILRFVETRFDLPALTARDANADPMLEFFDFQNPPFATPPVLPPAVVNQAEFDYCANLAVTPSGDL